MIGTCTRRDDGAFCATPFRNISSAMPPIGPAQRVSQRDANPPIPYATTRQRLRAARPHCATRIAHVPSAAALLFGHRQDHRRKHRRMREREATEDAVFRLPSSRFDAAFHSEALSLASHWTLAPTTALITPSLLLMMYNSPAASTPRRISDRPPGTRSAPGRCSALPPRA